MNNFEEVIDDIMSKLDVKDEFEVEVNNLTSVDKSTIIETIEDSGYIVDTSYGEDILYVRR